MPVIPVGGGVQIMPAQRERRGTGAAEILRMLMEQQNRSQYQDQSQQMQTLALLGPLLQQQTAMAGIQAGQNQASQQFDFLREQLAQSEDQFGQSLGQRKYEADLQDSLTRFLSGEQGSNIDKQLAGSLQQIQASGNIQKDIAGLTNQGAKDLAQLNYDLGSRQIESANAAARPAIVGQNLDVLDRTVSSAVRGVEGGSQVQSARVSSDQEKYMRKRSDAANNFGAFSSTKVARPQRNIGPISTAINWAFNSDVTSGRFKGNVDDILKKASSETDPVKVSAIADYITANLDTTFSGVGQTNRERLLEWIGSPSTKKAIERAREIENSFLDAPVRIAEDKNAQISRLLERASGAIGNIVAGDGLNDPYQIQQILNSRSDLQQLPAQPTETDMETIAAYLRAAGLNGE